MLDSENTGTTACVVLLTVENKERVCYVANVGDTRAVLITSSGFQRLSYDHRPADSGEIVRVQYDTCENRIGRREDSSWAVGWVDSWR